MEIEIILFYAGAVFFVTVGIMGWCLFNLRKSLHGVFSLFNALQDTTEKMLSIMGCGDVGSLHTIEDAYLIFEVKLLADETKQLVRDVRRLNKMQGINNGV